MGTRAALASASAVMVLVNPAPQVVVATAMPPPARKKASAAATAPASWRVAVYGKPRDVRWLTTCEFALPTSPKTWSARARMTSAMAVETVAARVVSVRGAGTLVSPASAAGEALAWVAASSTATGAPCPIVLVSGRVVSAVYRCTEGLLRRRTGAADKCRGRLLPMAQVSGRVKPSITD